MTAIFQRRPGSSSAGSCASSSISWTKSSLAMRFIHNRNRLGRRRLGGGYTRKGNAKTRAPAQPRLEAQPSAQLLRHEIVDDVQTEPGSALVSARREEGIERAALGFF